MIKDQYGNKLATFTKTMPCTPLGQSGPECPAGWESVGYTQPGTCIIGNVPGDGPMDSWKMYGYNRVCKRRVPSSGDLAVDCCSNLFGISDSLECNSRGYKPYSWECNNIMVKKCNTNVHKNPYAPEWDGMPNGQDPIIRDCTGQIRGSTPKQNHGCVDEFCTNYLRNAPPNNFFHSHDYQDYPYHFPKYSYVTPAFDKTWGYQPMRTPYKAYNDYRSKNENNYCRQFPRECWNELMNDYHF